MKRVAIQGEAGCFHEEAARRYFQNYMAALYTVFGGFADYDEAIELIQDTVIYLAGKNPDKLIEAIYTHIKSIFVKEAEA